jgi:predicted Zn-dependent protease
MTPSDELRPEGSGDLLPDIELPKLKKSQLDFDIEFFDSILRRAPDYLDVLRCQGELLSRKGQHARALEIDRRLAAALPHDSVVQYNLACSLACNGLTADAVAALRRAFERGYDDFEHLDLDQDLESLRNDPRYAALIDEFRPAPIPPRRAKKSRRK